MGLRASARVPLLGLCLASVSCADTTTSPSDRTGLTLHVSSARAEMVTHADGASGVVYTLCYAIGVANALRKPMTIQGIEFTLIRADGSTSSSAGESSVSGQRIGGGASSRMYGCPVVFEERHTASPSATGYRMRVEYTFDIAGAAAPHTVIAEGPFETMIRPAP